MKGIISLLPVFYTRQKENRRCTLKIKYQHIRYIPSAVRADKLNERTSIQNFRTQTLKGKFNEGDDRQMV